MDKYIKREDAIRIVARVTARYAEDEAMKSLCLNALLSAPTADVVPKSEVDRLNAVMKEMDEQRAYTINMLAESLANAKTEVAREIFEELEKYFSNNEHKTGILLYCNFFNIKKKYVKAAEETKVPEEKFFTPEDVRKLTLKEVRENYQAIQRSMKQWK